MRLSLMVTLLALKAAAGEAPADRSPTRAADSAGRLAAEEFRKKYGGDFARCESGECVEAALAGCRPSHLAKSFYTVEGSPAYLDYFVVPLGDGCKVVELADFSDDYWGGCKIEQRICPSFAAATRGAKEGGECSRREVLFERRPCSMPAEHAFGGEELPPGEITRTQEAAAAGISQSAWTLRDASFKSISISAVGGLTRGPRVVLTSQSGAQAGIWIGDYVGRERYRLRRAERIVGGTCLVFESAAGIRERLCQRGLLGDFPVPEREASPPERPGR
jgi:hypothetical protein